MKQSETSYKTLTSASPIESEEPNNVTSNQILECEVADDSGLHDFQKLPDQESIAIPKVGIGRFRIPMSFNVQTNNELITRSHDVEAAMSVNLTKGKTGINMSRLCAILQEETQTQSVDLDLLQRIVTRYQYDLRDSESENPIEQARLSLKFNYATQQKSLKSDNWGWQYYPCEIKITKENSVERVFVTLNYEYSSTCPCSLSMAKQYEREFQEGKTTEGNGIGVAHSQRSGLKLTVELNLSKLSDEERKNCSIETLLGLIRTAVPTETQSLVKRIDEQAFAILNGSNPMFVEHSSKRLYKIMNSNEKIIDWVADIEHWESLHSHNAVATIGKDRPNGLLEKTLV